MACMLPNSSRVHISPGFTKLEHPPPAKAPPHRAQAQATQETAEAPASGPAAGCTVTSQLKQPGTCMQTACPNLSPRVPGGVGATTTAAAPTLTARTSGVLACSGQLLSCPPAYLSVLLHPACAAHAAPSPALRRHPGTNPCVPLTPESVVIIFP